MDEYTDIVNEKTIRKKTITSYGIVLYTIKNGNIHYLLGKQRDSITIKELFYQVIPNEDIPKYASYLTKNEKYKLLNNSFEELINDIFVAPNKRDISVVKNNKEIYNTNINNFKKYLTNNNIGQDDNFWIFPRGRKRFNESEIQCVLRELREETGIKQYIGILKDDEQMEEYYVGLNKKLYKIVYYIGYMDCNSIKKPINRTKTNMRHTVSDELDCIKWFKYDDAYNLLDLTKQYILKNINSKLLMSLKRIPIVRRHTI